MGFGRRGFARWGRPPPLPAAQPWYNLSLQQLQATAASCLDSRCAPVPDRPDHRRADDAQLALQAFGRDGAETASEWVSSLDLDKLDSASKVEPEKEDESKAQEKPERAEPKAEEEPSKPESEAEGASRKPEPKTEEEPKQPEPQAAPYCGGANRGCVQHCEDDAFEGGGCLQVRRSHCEDSGLSLHRLFLCDLKSESGRMRVVHAAKRGPGDGDATPAPAPAPLRLALVLRDTPDAAPRLVWVDEVKGCRLQRSLDGQKWESLIKTNENDTYESNLISWQVWAHVVAVAGHITEVLVALPPNCNSALLGLLEITEAPSEDPIL